MTVDITLRNSRDLEEFQKNLRTVRMQLPHFREVKLKEIAEKTLLETIKQRMRGALYPDRVIENTFISGIIATDTDFEVKVKSELILENGFDLADGFENGTRSSPGRFVPAIEKRLISKDRDIGIHPGTQAHKIIETTVKEFNNVIKIEYDKEEKLWLQGNLK